MSWRYTIWKEGKYLDLWSLNHFLIGVIYGSILFSAGVSFLAAFVVGFVLSVLWEIFELVVLGVKEARTNQTMDVMTSIIGFLFSAYSFFILNKPFSTLFVVLLIFLYISLGVWGFTAWKGRMRDKNVR